MYRTTLGVDGLMCGMCESHVREAVLKALERNRITAKKVKASKANKTLVVLAEQPIAEKLLRAAVEATGYSTTHFRSEPYVEKGFFARIGSLFSHG